MLFAFDLGAIAGAINEVASNILSEINFLVDYLLPVYISNMASNLAWPPSLATNWPHRIT